MKKTATIIFIFFYISCFSKHKDQVFSNKYGNVKTFVKTGFNNYAATSRVEILGQLAKKLCLKLSYKDTIVIEFCHDYTKFYDKIIIVENGNSLTEYLISNSIEKIQEHQKKSHSLIKDKSAICIRQIDSDFDIIKTLKIIEYCILNKFENDLINVHCKSTFHFDNREMINIQYFGMPNKLINQIKRSNNTPILKAVLNEKIAFYNHFEVQGYYKNNIYHFENNKTQLETKNLIYIVNLSNGVAIFPKKGSFIYLSKDIVKVKKNFISISGNYPYLTYNADIYRGFQQLEKDNIMLYKHGITKRIIFSESDNKILEVREK